MSQTVGMIDLQKLAQNFADLSGEKYTTVAARLVQDAAYQVETLAKAYAPVRTGALRQSIHTTFSNKGLSASVSTDVPYAGFLEFGTGIRGEFGGAQPVSDLKVRGVRISTSGGRSMGMAPRPYMRPAAERVGDSLSDALGESAQVSIVMGPHVPETLSNAPATSPSMSSSAVSTVNQHISNSKAGKYSNAVSAGSGLLEAGRL